MPYNIVLRTWRENTKIEDVSQVSYGEIEYSAHGEWEQMDQACGSDYSGGTYTRSNYEIISKMLADGELSDLDVKLLYGSHGNYGILYRITSAESPQNEQQEVLADLISALDGYPVLDDEHLSALEWELTRESWDNCYSSDYRRGLIEKFADNEESEKKADKIERLIDEIDSDSFFELFEQIRERVNVYWEPEHADMYVDVKRVIDATEWGDVVPYLALPVPYLALPTHLSGEIVCNAVKWFMINAPFERIVCHASLLYGLLPSSIIVGNVAPNSFDVMAVIS